MCKKCQFSKSRKQDITLQKQVHLVTNSLHTFLDKTFQPFHKSYSVTKSCVGHQLQRVRKHDIPNCKNILNALYHVP